VRAPLQLGADEVHVWLAWTDAVDPVADARCATLLSAEERARHDRFHFERDRQLYRVAHALVRTSLSRYAPVAPAAWRFVATPHGRPELLPGNGGVPLRFNLSHTRGLVACVVSLAREVGVDVEAEERPGNPLDRVSDHFAPAEVAALRALPAAAQPTRFFTLWTLKEAYIKARGLGLAIPLDRFSFEVPASSSTPITIAFTPPIDDDPASWHFESMQPGPRHFLACAARRRAGETLRLRVRTTTPLGD